MVEVKKKKNLFISVGKRTVFHNQIDHILWPTPGLNPSMHLALRAPTVSCHYHIKGHSSTMSWPERKRRASTSTASRFNFSHGAIWISMAGDADGCMSVCTQTHTHADVYRLRCTLALTHAGNTLCMYTSSHACHCSHLLWFIFLFVMKITGRTGQRNEETTLIQCVCVSLCFMNILFQIQLCFQAPGQATHNNSVSLPAMLSFCSPQTTETTEGNIFSAKSLWKPFNVVGWVEQDTRFYLTKSPAILWNEEEL